MILHMLVRLQTRSHQKIQAHVHTQTCQKHLEDLWRRWACFWDNIFPYILFFDTDALYIVMVYVYVFLTWASPMNIRYQSGLREGPAPWSWKFDEDRPCDHRVYCGQDDETPQGRSRFYCHYRIQHCITWYPSMCDDYGIHLSARWASFKASSSLPVWKWSHL